MQDAKNHDYETKDKSGNLEDEPGCVFWRNGDASSGYFNEISWKYDFL